MDEEFYTGEKDDIARVLQGYRAQLDEGLAIYFKMIDRALEGGNLEAMRTACIYLWRNSGLTRRK